MKKSNFLIKLHHQGRLKIVGPSEDICHSYLEKADKSLKSAKILLQNRLYENSISMSYYAMYHSLTALLFKTGIKCENHTGSLILLKNLFHRKNLHHTISSAKKERIDKQYYVDHTLSQPTAQSLYREAEDFMIELKLIIKNLKNEDIKKLRDGLKHSLK